MSDCLDCENTGYIEEFIESSDDELKGVWRTHPCRGWRHRRGPSLEEIAHAIREGREPPHSYVTPDTGAEIGKGA